MKALIIGGAGFVGGHLIKYLSSSNAVEVYATKLPNESINEDGILRDHIYDLDILEKQQVSEIIGKLRPDYIFHLAAQSSVSLSWKEPALTYNINVVGTINVLEIVKELHLKSRILLVGSSEQYGKVKAQDLPVNEDYKITPVNPYALSKASQEAIAKLFVHTYDLDIIMVRAFNHIGPGQSPTFVISDFAKQVVEIEMCMREPILYVGNLGVKRDFSDVRDIVAGYWLLLQNGKKGEIYNIGSGKSYQIGELLNILIQMSELDITVKVDEKKFRPADIEDLQADIQKIIRDTGWHPEIDINTTLMDILDYWKKRC